MNTDAVVAVSDKACDALSMVFNTDTGQKFLTEDRRIDQSIISTLGHFGLSSICNVLAAIKVAKELSLGPQDALMTVATDGAEMYQSEREALANGRYQKGFGTSEAGLSTERYLTNTEGSEIEILNDSGRKRIFNLGYFTWVEQQGVSVDDFEIRRDLRFWHDIQAIAPIWDTMIQEFNARTGVLASS